MLTQRFKHALQAAAIMAMLLIVLLLLINPDALNNTSNIINLGWLFIVVFTVAFLSWWVAFTSENFQPLLVTLVGIVIAVASILLPLWIDNCFSGNCTLQQGRLQNGGSLAAVIIFGLLAISIPISIITSLLIRYFQTKKTTSSRSSIKERSIEKSIFLLFFQLFTIIGIGIATLIVIDLLTNDYVGTEGEVQIAKIGNQLNFEIKEYYKQHGSYPNNLTLLPSSNSKEFEKYKKWGAFHYNSNVIRSSKVYQLLWKYSLNRAIICSNSMSFWPKRMEGIPTPHPNSHGCYSIDPDNIKEPPLVQ
jgi:hypothetical protein